jgi:hypothetical protein
MRARGMRDEVIIPVMAGDGRRYGGGEAWRAAAAGQYE